MTDVDETPVRLVGKCPVSHTAAYGVADPMLFSDGDYRATWAHLRELDRLTWQQVDDRRGFWSVVKYEDADRVLRDHETFTSERGTMLDTLGTQDPAGGRQIPVTDPPRHTGMRARLQKALTPKSLEAQHAAIRGLVRELFAPLGDGGTFDFAQAMLMLPVAVAGVQMDLPREDWPRLCHLLNASIAGHDPDYLDTASGDAVATVDGAHRELFAYFQEIYRERKRKLGDDLISVLMTTQVDGRPMAPGEVMSNCYSVLLGASVTTPHSPNYVMAEQIGTGLLDEWAADISVTASAVEEALRLAAPVNYFMRHATRDVEVRGTTVKEGDPLVVWFGSANRDGDAFPDPDEFQLRRKPNRHLSFGMGPHYCVGHTLARATLKILFEELLTSYHRFESAGTPVRMRSTFVSGYKHLPITARPI
ncbi:MULTISPECIES: cytochrome P450 [unclassified Streptomyces]|uniref:cytochrome P450 n=1 Tax=unclassified Streptomyces TaxID=2593676 RepID=UPI0023654930|nr:MULTISPECIES: cytochrome P450 [unclassified Streptomyces]MDF3140231.1 cytochrome P450 [Streptomyces sp. T21Q-yed]WDF38197.1 cytochrome P450 [Streptomyces sp. T12]